MVQIGDIALRKEVVDSTIKGMAARMYKFKQAVSIVATSAISNIYWTEASAALASTASGADWEPTPFGAGFATASPDWDRHQSNIKKHAIEDNIAWELIKSSEIDIQGRTMFKLTEAITKSVDDDIYTQLTKNWTGGTPSNINFLRIDNMRQWNWPASAAIVDNLMHASQKIAKSNYSTGNLMGFVSPRDKRSIMNYLYTKGSQTPSIATDVAVNGYITKLAGITLIESNSVPASSALVVVPKICATYKQFEPLTTDTTIDPLKSVRIRVIEEGVVQVTDPEAICLITNTQNETDPI